MVEKYCPICEVQHEVEIIENGVDNGIEWSAYRCDITSKEFERWINCFGKWRHNIVHGRRICLMSEQSPSTIEQVPERSAFNLDTLDRVSFMISNITPLSRREGKEQYLSQFIEILSQNLRNLFVGIHFVDADEDWLSFQAGNHEKISSLLHEHAPKVRIRDHNNYFGQAGAAICANEIRLVHWGTGNIISYKIVDGKVHEKILKDYSEPFQSPWYGNTELYFPLQNGNRKIGVLECTFDFDVSPWISHVELLKVQMLADQLTTVLSEGKNS